MWNEIMQKISGENVHWSPDGSSWDGHKNSTSGAYHLSMSVMGPMHSQKADHVQD